MSKEYIDKIKNANRESNGVMYLSTTKEIDINNAFGNKDLYLIFGTKKDFDYILSQYKTEIKNHRIELHSVNQTIPLLDYQMYENVRIEPNACIRKGVTLHKGAIVLMGAVINIGASIGENTMVDMNAVVGSGAVIKDNVHIGAGSVISGVLEPYSTKPVIIENNAIIGANSVILEGVKIGSNAVVGAGAVCTRDVEDYEVVGGVPAKHIKYKDEKTKEKTIILDELR